MAELTLAFHSSLQLPPAGRGLVGATIACEFAWTVRQLASAIERYCASTAGIGVRVCTLINPARGKASPPHEHAKEHFKNGDKVVVLGDVRPAPWPAEPDQKVKSAGEPVPITIFTGFLGAGKTTVLNYLLRGQREKKIAVIENEFGAVPIDNELLKNSALDLAEQVVVMENGCMCCTVRGDLLGAFDQIRKQMDQGNPLDAVLIETTGMADPVPIVRTLRQTPDIARYFRLDGTITLVDAKTILARLGECAEGVDDQERHRQISFADRILLNKIDLVSDEEVVEVFRRIRVYNDNDNVRIIASVKGILPPADLTNLGAFDIEQIALEQEEHGHGHAHSHGHGGHGGHGSHGGHGHDDCDEECHEDHGGGGGHTIGHSHSHGLGKSHDSEIGSFSIVMRDHEVDKLEFERWVRIIATLPEEQGKLYRSKGVLAATGRQAKLIFHAVADVTETQDGPEWGEHEQRICKMVFIGKKLDRKKIEERFLPVLRPCKQLLRPNLPAASPTFSSRRPTLVSLAQAGQLQRALVGCWTEDVLRVSQASASLHDLLYGPQALAAFQRGGLGIPTGQPRGMQKVRKEGGHVWLHALLPLATIQRYVLAFNEAKVELKTPFHKDHFDGEPLSFHDLADVEAAGVMWLELSELRSTDDTINVVVEFKWREETLKSFFDVEGSATNSALIKITVEDPEGDIDADDDLKFRVNLNPEKIEESGMSMHRLSLQLVGGKSSYRIYQIFFHTIDPSYQVHINVPDHRVPIFPTKEVFHQWHPLMAGLKRRPRLRFLIRLRPMESGPLDAMCGCCG